MLIPRGRIIHENLPTSYVLVEALVSDLCEGGFSGVVAIALREIDGFVVIANGRVGAVIEMVNGQNRETERTTFDRSTLSKLSAKARLERGLLSIHRYSGETADAVAGRINALSLYARLSTEFTDLETMLSKLAREADREWFVEINTDENLSALVHVRDRQFHVIASRGEHEEEWDALELADDAARQKLFMECKKAAGTFDVYFKDPDAASIADEAEPLAEAPHAVLEPEVVQPGADLRTNPSAVEASTENVADPSTQEFANELSLGREEFAPAGDEDETMTELKRLMGEIAGTIEGSAQAVDRHDGFAMCLRAGQLKIADRYPFLDPFASEFEYLTGEIVFVGQATAEQFVAGLTEALSLAIKSLEETNTYGEKFRAYVREDLGKLLARSRTELESYGLDQVIQQIISS